MSDFYNGSTSGIHAMFDQELAEFMRLPYERLVKNRAYAQKPAEEPDLTEKVLHELDEPQGAGKIINIMDARGPQRPPSKRTA